jgi:hypothetical protein
MQLPAINNYFYFRGTLSKLSKKGYGELSEVHVNILFSIHCITEEGIQCTKNALYEFMSNNYHTPHKATLFALIRALKTNGKIRESVGAGFKFLTLTLEGELLLFSLNDRLLLEKVKR